MSSIIFMKTKISEKNRHPKRVPIREMVLSQLAAGSIGLRRNDGRHHILQIHHKNPPENIRPLIRRIQLIQRLEKIRRCKIRGTVIH